MSRQAKNSQLDKNTLKSDIQKRSYNIIGISTDIEIVNSGELPRLRAKPNVYWICVKEKCKD
jgi:phenylacetate-coenzyme A ligase PaaK-like adenylate-forming protein